MRCVTPEIFCKNVGEGNFKNPRKKDFMEESGLPYVLQNQNPPNAPQTRPFAHELWSILKQKVYAGNWSFKSREVLIRRIKKVICEIDQNIIVKMFENLGNKIISAGDNQLQIPYLSNNCLV